MIGTRLGPYEITGKLGEGGMGEVYRAHDASLGRDVALKVLPAAFTEDAERLARFEREAKLLAQLNHPNIAHVYGLEASGTARALVMELVDGEDLAQRIARGSLPVDEALPIARQIAEALEAAHERGIVHRDLKPANVKLREDGTVKVLDFGLAKATDPHAGSGAPANAALSPTLMHSPTLTAVHGTALGVILGTAAYMAPEQARGGAVDARADVWAFGVVLYEMLTGRQPFLADTVPDTLAQVLTREIDPATLPAAVPGALRDLVMRCLVRQPKNRLHSIADARIALDGLLVRREPEPSAAAAQRRSAKRRLLPWLGGAALGLVLGYAIHPRAPSGAATAPSNARARFRTLVSVGTSQNPTLSADGNTLAFTSTRGGVHRVWIKDLKSGSESPLAPPPSRGGSFSPDGSSLLYQSNDDAFRISLATRETRRVAGGVATALWLPNGLLLDRWLQEKSVEELLLSDFDGGKERLVYRETKQELGVLRASPDGKRLAITLFGRQAGEIDTLRLIDVASGKTEDLSLALPGFNGGRVTGLDWFAPDRIALLISDDHPLISSAGRLAVYDLARRRLEPLLPLPSTGMGLTVAGPDSVIVGQGSQERNLFEYRRAAAGWSQPAARTEGPFHDRQPAYSPDGRSLVFSSGRSGNLDLWRMDLATGDLTRLTDDPAEDWDPGFSSDGKSLVFSSNRSGRFQIWIADADGNMPRQVTDVENAQNPTMTPDGWIVYTLQDAPEDKRGLWKVRPDGSGAARIASGAFSHPEVSPDGKFVSTLGVFTGLLETFRMADGTKVPAMSVLPNTDRYRFSVEGKTTYLWCIRYSDKATEVIRAELDETAERLGPPHAVLSEEPGAPFDSLGVSRDGSRFTLSRSTNLRSSLVRIDGLEGLSR